MSALKFNIKLITLSPTQSTKHRGDIMDLICQHMTQLKLALAKAEIKADWGYAAEEGCVNRYGIQVPKQEVEQLFKENSLLLEMENNITDYNDDQFDEQHTKCGKLFDNL